MTDEEKPIIYLSREELEGRIATSIFIEQRSGPLVFEQLALHPHYRDGIEHLQGDYSGIHLQEIVAHGAIMESVYIPGARMRGADLSGADCCSSDFRQVDLSGAHLVGVNFSASYLNLASFRGADLSGANLGYAMLIGADFTDANLTNANLEGATMMRVNLTRAKLTGANFKCTGLDGAYVFETVFHPLQLQEAGFKNLVDGAKARQ